MTTDPRTTAELIEEADHQPADRATADRLDAIRAVAESGGVRAEVTVHGALAGLRIDERAMRLAPHRLADLIAELVAEATRTATAEALALLYWAGGPALAAHPALLTDALDTDVPDTDALNDGGRTTSTPEPADPDTLEPASWAV